MVMLLMIGCAAKPAWLLHTYANGCTLERDTDEVERIYCPPNTSKEVLDQMSERIVPIHLRN
jgi:hypothetical protein